MTLSHENAETRQVNGTVQRIKMTRKVFGKAAIVKTVPSNLTCYQRISGTVALGHVPISKCRSLIRENETYDRNNCYCCLIGLRPCISHDMEPLTALVWHWSNDNIRAKCAMNCTHSAR